MTIAACYVSHEGVVLGADSTTTYFFGSSPRHYHNAQKIFEIGEVGSSLGLVTWGRGSLPKKSYRQLAAELSDSLLAHEPPSVEDASHRWSDLFWQQYADQFEHELQRYRHLDSQPNRSPSEEEELARLSQSMTVGFCIGGHVTVDRTPAAFELLFTPAIISAAKPTAVIRNQPRFWGVPNMMDRLLSGIDASLFADILESPYWQGTPEELFSLVMPYTLSSQLELPLREAIDWIFSSIFITIKALKFSSLPPFCGGPIELAAITADRRFRWVCHKGLDQALTDHAARGTY